MEKWTKTVETYLHLFATARHSNEMVLPSITVLFLTVGNDIIDGSGHATSAGMIEAVFSESSTK